MRGKSGFKVQKRVWILLVLTLIFSFLAIGTAHAATISGSIYDYKLDKLDQVLIQINTTPNQQFLTEYGVYSVNLEKGEYLLKASYGDLSTEEEIVVDENGSYTVDLFLFPSFETEEELWQNEENLFGINETKDKVSLLRIIQIAGFFLLVIGSLILFFLFVRKTFLTENKETKENQENKGRNVNNENKVRDEKDLILKQETIQKEISEDESLAEEVFSKADFEEVVIENQDDLDENESLESGNANFDIDQKISSDEFLSKAMKIIIENDGRITQKVLRENMADLSEAKVSLIVTELEHLGKVKKIKQGRGNVILLNR